MKPIDVLIIEDEARIAEINSFYLQQTPQFRPVGIAKNLSEARNLIRILKPTLIFLDNFLPDGKGLDLLKELITYPHPPDVIFITAASDTETVREAVRCGVFDYLLKPLAYERVQDSLERYIKYSNSLRASDNINQRHVDALFNFQAKVQHLEALPKGIDELTLGKIKEIYEEDPQPYTAESLGNALGMSKTTSRRYLEFCVSSGFLEAKISHGSVGRPERTYQKSR